MISSDFFRQRFSLAALFFCLFLAFPGCSKKSSGISTAGVSFDSAPAELQTKWKSATEAVAKKDYAAAVPDFVFILEKADQLTPEQKSALDQAWLELGNQAFQAADGGDQNATKAVLEMRASKFGQPRDGR